MAFQINNFRPASAHLQVGSGGELVPGAPSIHTYRSEDATTVVDAAGYFNAVRQHLQVGDLIYRVTVNSSGVVQNAGFHVVMTKSAAAVDVSDTLATTVTNTRV